MIKFVPTQKTHCDHSRLCFRCGSFEFVIGVMVGLMGALMIVRALG
ncbi:MAG TPA: hypothetical protein VJH22_00190 [Candidatus Nanoarchaeia archaeon]|nr:hypothetical protein [Candidatus Nanoarchaeia archaeon]